MLVIGGELVPGFGPRAPLASEDAADSIGEDEEVLTLRLRSRVVQVDIGLERVYGSRHTREWLSRLPLRPLDRRVNMLRRAPKSTRKSSKVEKVVQAIVTRAMIGKIFM